MNLCSFHLMKLQRGREKKESKCKEELDFQSTCYD